MKRLLVAAMLATSSLAVAQGTPPAGAAAPTAAPTAKFTPQMPKTNPAMLKEFLAAVKNHHDAWSFLDANKVAADWAFPAVLVTTDAQGNPSVFQVDEASLKSALTAAFAQVPKPNPGEPAAKINWKNPHIEWQSNTLATVTVEADLVQGKGKNTFKLSWKTTELWSRDSAGWKLKGYVSSGWSDLFKH